MFNVLSKAQLVFIIHDISRSNFDPIQVLQLTKKKRKAARSMIYSFSQNCIKLTHFLIVGHFTKQLCWPWVAVCSLQIMDGWQWRLHCKHHCRHEQRISWNGVSCILLSRLKCNIYEHLSASFTWVYFYFIKAHWCSTSWSSKLDHELSCWVDR